MNKNKKLLIECAGIVITILSASFTSVIGQNSDHAGINDSPLFAIRTQKTINGKQKPITTWFLGKGTESNILITFKDGKKNPLHLIIEKIRYMTEPQLMKLANLICSNKTLHKNRQQILPFLYQLKNNPDEMMKQLSAIPKDSSHITRGCPPTTFPLCLPSSQWFPGCTLWWIWVIINYVVIIIISIFLGDN
jgi:hypothetical protein